MSDFWRSRERTFVVAEIGSNHNRSLGLAKELIDAAASSGADAAKFQIYSASTLYSAKDDERLGYDGANVTKLIEGAATPREWLPELSDYCAARGVIFFAAPFDMAAVDELDAVSGLFKIASFEIVDLPLIRNTASKGKPMIIATGLANMGEIEDAVTACKESGNSDIALLQCASCYPAPPAIMNLRSMETMRRAFGAPVGLSDHTLGIHISTAAVAMGASIIEKHFTIDRTMKGPDHSFAIEPRELAELVREIREIESALGNGMKTGPAAEELTAYGYARRSIHSLVDIKKGTVITKDMLITKRPGHGIRPKYISWVAGRRAARDITSDSWITMEMLD
ncbi:MAG: N-acetylneuraminate synthase family protein [Synergistaceae bacterium]|jgi:N-acetylneuraminate synthase/N,N'-diacetyllegionaminate synthase|nr:N-acetylneuraminate synthase family protein [Synergistaceae bacterium]